MKNVKNQIKKYIKILVLVFCPLLALIGGISFLIQPISPHEVLTFIISLIVAVIIAPILMLWLEWLIDKNIL